MKIVLARIEITSGNSMHKLHREVKGYEVPLIHAAHGVDNVKILDRVVGTIDIEAGPHEEYDRLIQLYARRDGALVRQVYRDPAELARAMALCEVGEPEGEVYGVGADGISEPLQDDGTPYPEPAEAPAKKKPGRKPANSQ